MITPRRQRSLPNNLTLNLALINGFESDGPALEERRKAFVETFHFRRPSDILTAKTKPRQVNENPAIGL
jgi:hypothetical protein